MTHHEIKFMMVPHTQTAQANTTSKIICHLKNESSVKGQIFIFLTQEHFKPDLQSHLKCCSCGAQLAADEDIVTADSRSECVDSQIHIKLKTDQMVKSTELLIVLPMQQSSWCNASPGACKMFGSQHSVNITTAMFFPGTMLECCQMSKQGTGRSCCQIRTKTNTNCVCFIIVGRLVCCNAVKMTD